MNPVRGHVLWSVMLSIVVLMPAGAHAQRAIFVVRHAEKMDDSKDPALSAAGKERAERLAGMLKDADVSAIYSTSFRRTMETAEPLARARHLTVTSYDPSDSTKFLARLRAEHPDDAVLVVGHSNTVPELLRAAGLASPIEIQDSEYTNLFVVIPLDGRPATVLRLRY